MSRTSPTITLREIGGNQFQDLAAAQRSARAVMAFDMAQIIKCMIEQGILEIKDGKISPKGSMR